MKVAVEKLDVAKLISDLNVLNQKCIHLRNISEYDKNDTRSLIFLFLSADIQNLLLSLSLSKNLTDVEFYKANGYKTENINNEYLENALFQFVSFIGNSYFFSIFIQLENHLRLIAKHKGIVDYKIKNTIKNLVNTFGLNINNLDLCEIILELRNSVHQGGFFNHPSKHIIYKEVQYDFINGNPVQYGGIPFYTFLTKEIIENLLEELNHNSSSETLISHNYSNLDFEVEE